MCMFACSHHLHGGFNVRRAALAILAGPDGSPVEVRFPEGCDREVPAGCRPNPPCVQACPAEALACAG